MNLFALVGAAALGLGYLFYHDEPKLRGLVALRKGASFCTLRKRRRYGGKKGRRAARLMNRATRFVRGLTRQPAGWKRVGVEMPVILPLELYVQECAWGVVEG